MAGGLPVPHLSGMLLLLQPMRWILGFDTNQALSRNLLCVGVVSNRTDRSVPWARWTMLELPTVDIPPPLLQPFLPLSTANLVEPLPGGWTNSARTLGALLGLKQILPEVFTSYHHPAVTGYATNISFPIQWPLSSTTPSYPPCDTACQHESPLQKSWQRQKEEGKAHYPLQGSKTKSTLWPLFSSLPLSHMLSRPPPGSHLLQHLGSMVLPMQLQATTLTHPNRL